VADDPLLVFVALGVVAERLKAARAGWDSELETARYQVAMAMLAAATVVLEFAKAKNDGKCQCKCINPNDGPYPKGRMTRADCIVACKPYSTFVCK